MSKELWTPPVGFPHSLHLSTELSDADLDMNSDWRSSQCHHTHRASSSQWIFWCWTRWALHLKDFLYSFMTFVGFSSCMNPLILNEVWALVEGFPTVATLKGFSPRMNSLVDYKAWVINEDFATFTTLMVFLPCGSFLMGDNHLKCFPWAGDCLSLSTSGFLCCCSKVLWTSEVASNVEVQAGGEFFWEHLWFYFSNEWFWQWSFVPGLWVIFILWERVGLLRCTLELGLRAWCLLLLWFFLCRSMCRAWDPKVIRHQ